MNNEKYTQYTVHSKMPTVLYVSFDIVIRTAVSSFRIKISTVQRTRRSYLDDKRKKTHTHSCHEIRMTNAQSFRKASDTRAAFAVRLSLRGNRILFQSVEEITSHPAIEIGTWLRAHIATLWHIPTSHKKIPPIRQASGSVRIFAAPEACVACPVDKLVCSEIDAHQHALKSKQQREKCGQN